jgi:2-dehydropantoate 2-reductase
MNATEHPFPKACIVGAGAIGGWLGAGLARAGSNVSVLARGATLQALREGGLRLVRNTPDGPVTETHAVQASDDATQLGVQDLVVIAVKAPALRAVAQQIAPMLGPQTVVLIAMNGVPWWFLQGFGGALQGRQLHSVDPDGAIAAAIPPQHIVGCVLHLSSAIQSPGVVRHHFGNRLFIGEPSGVRSDRVLALAQTLERAGFEAPVSEQIQRDIWYKLWGNMTLNPVSALTGATGDRILADPLVRRFCSAAMDEAQAIGARIGCAITQSAEDRHAITARLGAFKTSMLQDTEAGRAIELDAIVGAVREIGTRLDLPTPHIDALYGLTRLFGRVHGLYPENAS